MDGTYLWASLECDSANLGEQGEELGLLWGSGTLAEFLVAEMLNGTGQCQHSLVVCRGRLDGESRNENLKACSLAAEDSTESKILNADGSEGAQDVVD